MSKKFSSLVKKIKPSFTLQMTARAAELRSQGEDVINTLKAMRLLGVQIFKTDKHYEVFGIPPGGLIQPKKKIDFGILDVTFYRDDFQQRLLQPQIKGSDINFELNDKMKLYSQIIQNQDDRMLGTWLVYGDKVWLESVSYTHLRAHET